MRGRSLARRPVIQERRSALLRAGWRRDRRRSSHHNVQFGPSIQVRSVVRRIAPAFAGRGYETRGVIGAAVTMAGRGGA